MASILEAITGPSISDRLQQHYRLEVEPELPDLIAGDLLADPGSPVAPTLQILLSKMWSIASSEEPGSPRFTVALYHHLKRRGILLSDFVDEQLESLRRWRQELVESGLALDLLAFHTTPLGTSETRTADEVAACYGDRRDTAQELTEQCVDRYLLAGSVRARNTPPPSGPPSAVPSFGSSFPAGATRLAHDLLGPIIRSRFEQSELPGQRALRILQYRAREVEAGGEVRALDEADLAIVEQGEQGMRARTSTEERIFEASRRARASRARARRVRRVVVPAVAVIFAVLALTATAFWWISDGHRRRAEDTARVAMAGEWLQTDPTRAALVLLEVKDPDRGSYSVNRMREALDKGVAQAILRGHRKALKGAVFSPDGNRILTWSEDGTARVWRADGRGDPVVLRGHEGPVNSASFSPDGTRVVTSSDDHTVRIWPADGRDDPVVLRGHEGLVSSAAFSPDGTRIVTASADHTARVWPTDGRGEPVVLRGHEGPLNSASFSLDGARVVTAASDGTARVWAADGTGRPRILPVRVERFSSRPKADVVYASFSPDGTTVMTGSSGGVTQVWRAGGSDELAGPQRATSFSSDGRYIVTVWSNWTQVWAADGKGEPILLRGHQGQVRSAFFDPTGSKVVTCSYDGTARVWSLSGRSELAVLRGHDSDVTSATFSPDGTRIVTAAADGTARIWLVDRAEPVMLRGHQEMVVNAAFGPDGTRIVTASADGTARVWAADGKGEPLVLRGHEGVMMSAAFSSDGTRIVTASADSSARIWPADGVREAIVLRGHQSSVVSASFSPDGTQVLTVSADGTARIWPADGTGEAIVLRGYQTSVVSACFSPDGTRVLLALADGSARIQPSGRAGIPMVLHGHGSALLGASFSSDGGRILTVSTNGNARVWLADGSGKPIMLRAYGAKVRSASFSPDGKWMVTAEEDRTVRLWPSQGSAQPVVLREHERYIPYGVIFERGLWSVSFSGDGTALAKKLSRGSGRLLAREDLRLPVTSATFSPDGSRILALDNGFVWLMRTDGTGEPLPLFHNPAAASAAFSPDGTRMVTASFNGTAQVWTVTGKMLQKRIRELTSACLEPELRENALGESTAVARRKAADCERSQGRSIQ